MHIVVFIWLQSYEVLGANCSLKVWMPLTLATVESSRTSRLVENSLEGVNGTLHKLCSVVSKSHHTAHIGTGGILASSLTTVACFTMIFIIFSIWAPCILKVAVFTPLNTRGTVIVLVIFYLVAQVIYLVDEWNIWPIYPHSSLGNKEEVSVERIERVACSHWVQVLRLDCSHLNQGKGPSRRSYLAHGIGQSKTSYSSSHS